MLQSEIIYNIKNLMAGGIESDDQNFSNEQLSFIVNYYRARFLKQDQEKGRYSNSLYVQNLGNVPLIQADKNECCDTNGCILRTKDKIPFPLETFKGINLTFIGTLNGRPYQRTYHNAVVWKKGSRFTKNDTQWYYQNGYIYIVDPSSIMLSHINIQGIFEDPKKAEEFRTCDCDNGTDCYIGFDFEYPMPAHYIDALVKMVGESEMRMLYSILPDTLNDSYDQQSSSKTPVQPTQNG
jgi:hypothetical protein